MEDKDYYTIGLEKTALLGINPKSLKDVSASLEGTGPLLKATIGIASLTTFGLKAIINKIQNDTRRKALIEDLMSTDPIIKEADSTKVLEYYATIYNLAPTVSKEKPVVRELLQHFVRFGHIDLATIKTLTDTESKAANKPGGFSIKDFIKF